MSGAMARGGMFFLKLISFYGLLDGGIRLTFQTFWEVQSRGSVDGYLGHQQLEVGCDYPRDTLWVRRRSLCVWAGVLQQQSLVEICSAFDSVANVAAVDVVGSAVVVVVV